jgi:hypothetical protein
MTALSGEQVLKKRVQLKAETLLGHRLWIMMKYIWIGKDLYPNSCIDMYG